MSTSARPVVMGLWISAAVAAAVSPAAIVRMTMTDETTFVTDPTAPRHYHVVGEDRFACDSPYCGDGAIHLDPRKVPPVIKGREPWKGR